MEFQKILSPDEVPIAAQYPNLFSKAQVTAHTKHHWNYYRVLKEQVISNYGIKYKPLIAYTHLIRAHQACAGQLWYHNTFWANLTNEETSIGLETKKAIIQAYGSVESLKNCFISTATNHFSNGWYVLGFHRHYPPSLRCVTFKDGDTPMQHNIYPLLVIDLWEHSYYVDYPAEKTEYLKKVWDKINWDAVEQRLINKAQYIQKIGTYWL